LFGRPIDALTWSYDSELQEYYWRKVLKKVRRKGYDLNQVIAIDDSPKGYRDNYGNVIEISPFEGQDDDTELKDLLVYLDYLRPVENVRKLEKRKWKSVVANLKVTTLG